VYGATLGVEPVSSTVAGSLSVTQAWKLWPDVTSEGLAVSWIVKLLGVAVGVVRVHPVNRELCGSRQVLTEERGVGRG
jgi:hypothetical protein